MAANANSLSYDKSFAFIAAMRWRLTKVEKWAMTYLLLIAVLAAIGWILF
jgi:hypothetical protein